MIGKGWAGKKVLGKGSQGIVGPWTYEGVDRRQKTVTDVAVKSGAAGWLGRFSIFSGFRCWGWRELILESRSCVYMG